jgi:hypothetical protein
LLDVAMRLSVFNNDILTFNIAELAEALPECVVDHLRFRRLKGIGYEIADAPHTIGLLRTRHNRPRSRTRRKILAYRSESRGHDSVWNQSASGENNNMKRLMLGTLLAFASTFAHANTEQLNFNWDNGLYLVVQSQLGMSWGIATITENAGTLVFDITLDQSIVPNFFILRQVMPQQSASIST